MEIFNFDERVMVILSYVIETIRVNPITVAGILASLKMGAKMTKSTKDDKICTMLTNLFRKITFKNTKITKI